MAIMLTARAISTVPERPESALTLLFRVLYSLDSVDTELCRLATVPLSLETVLLKLETVLLKLVTELLRVETVLLSELI